MNSAIRQPPGPAVVEIYWKSRRDLLPGTVAFRASLSPEERERSQRYLAPRKKSDFILGRGFLRAVLALYTGGTGREINLITRSEGKPALPGDPLGFNLSHSGEIFLIAVAGSGEVGVDIQEIYPISNPSRLAEKYFSAAENRQLAEVLPDQAREAFFNCWVRKEAYLKGQGTGLRGRMDQISIIPDPEPDRFRVLDPGENHPPAPWTVVGLEVPPGYCAAAALRSSELILRDRTAEPLWTTARFS